MATNANCLLTRLLSRRWPLLAVASTVVFATLGCAIPLKRENGTLHHLIIGIGLVRCKGTSDPTVLATDTTAIGVSLSDAPGLKLGMGYTASTVVMIPSDTMDARVELSKRFGGSLAIDTHVSQHGAKEGMGSSGHD